MGRFDLSKGDRFDLKKSEGLSKLEVVLGWASGADLDASAFLLGNDGMIGDDADFVFYGSKNREVPFSREEHGNQNSWKKMTRPMSADGSVMGSLDDRDGGEGELMTVDLSKVGPKVCEIAFCVTVYDEGKTFGDVVDPYITIINAETGDELCRYDLKEQFTNQTAVVAGYLLVDDSGEWQFEARSEAYEGGLEALINVFAG